LGVPLLVAGGIATYADLEAIRDAGAEGAIVGRALLEGKIELGPALTIADATRDMGGIRPERQG
jgi:phosphoribosylformimino-5-aminoimidazole carboxamide ribotide isomerase